MIVATFTESVIEQAALGGLESAGWQVRYRAEIAPGEPAAERDDYGQVVLSQRLRDVPAQLNLTLPAEARDDAFRKLTKPKGAALRDTLFPSHVAGEMRAREAGRIATHVA